MKEIKMKSDVLGYNLMNFYVACLNSVLKMRLNQENMARRIKRVQCRPLT